MRHKNRDIILNSLFNKLSKLYKLLTLEFGCKVNHFKDCGVIVV